jgi:hypothetical protein
MFSANQNAKQATNGFALSCCERSRHDGSSSVFCHDKKVWQWNDDTSNT